MNLIIAYKRFWCHHKLLMVSLHLMLCSLLFTNVFIGIKPVVCKYKGELFYPNLSSTKDQENIFIEDLVGIAKYDYKKLSYDFVIWPLIHRDAKSMKPESAWQAPMTINQHGDYFLLGSYDLGRDLLSGCLYGLQKSLWLALIAILISGIIGIFMGSVFSFQSQRFKEVSFISIGLFLLFIFLFIYTIVIYFSWQNLNNSNLLILSVLQCICLVLAFYFSDHKPQKSFSLDFIALRYIEIMKSIPVILLLLILLQIFRNPDTPGLAWIISIVYIPIIAKYTRAFTLSASNEEYINSIITIGQTGSMIYFKHILPRVISEIIPILAFGISNIILAEASLSFLGLGMPPDEVSLGTIMYTARSFPSAWWVVVFPGLLVFWLVSTFNSWGELYSNRKWIRDIQS